MARYPVTQAQWRSVAGLPAIERDLHQNPASFRPNDLWEQYAHVESLPVESISWLDVQEWLRRLNSWLSEQMWQKTSYSQDYISFPGIPRVTLPSESQWEAACRAGSLTPFHFGATLDSTWANFDEAYRYGLGRRGVYRMRPMPVGFSGLVNRLGLADMHGQLHEWCADMWHRDPAGEEWHSDGSPNMQYDEGISGSSQQKFCLLRGGSWFNESVFCRSANRYSNHPAFVSPYSGLRPCCIFV
jgi:formylglycine-generating enzyme required for sulfatase activity